ncbi:hypothetical protein EJ07DRAFT_155996 [Lizonia empirigonia]|nr:hypothetical protein EJ07DRAFT_155996 [Lizonia empirigonia]
MDQSYESLLSASEFRPMLVSPHLSPQLNETICGCRCDCGCGCAGPGSDDDSERLSDSETAFDLSDSDEGEGFASDQQTHNNGPDGNNPSHMSCKILSPRALSHQVIFWLLGRAEHRQLEEPLEISEQVSFPSPLLEGHDVAESLLVEAFSAENRNHPASTRESVHMVSPGPGIGAWLVPEEIWIEDDQHVYIFMPLRLSAEYQHARGKAVEHLLDPDKTSVPDLV